MAQGHAKRAPPGYSQLPRLGNQKTPCAPNVAQGHAKRAPPEKSTKSTLPTLRESKDWCPLHRNARALAKGTESATSKGETGAAERAF